MFPDVFKCSHIMICSCAEFLSFDLSREADQIKRRNRKNPILDYVGFEIKESEGKNPPEVFDYDELDKYGFGVSFVLEDYITLFSSHSFCALVPCGTNYGRYVAFH